MSENLHRHFMKDAMWIANKYMERCSTSLNIGEM